MFSKKMLGSISPAYGIATGEGAIGKAASKGLLGLAPRIIAKNAKESDEESSRGAVGRAAGKSGKAEPQEGAPATGRPRGRGMIGRLAAPGQSAEAGSMAGNRAMGALGRAFRNGVRKNAPAAAADRPDQTMKKGGKVKHYRDGGIFREGMQVPQDPDGGSAPPKKPAPKKPEAKKPVPKKPVETKKFAKGGSVSSRADGCAQRGKTDCKIY